MEPEAKDMAEMCQSHGKSCSNALQSNMAAFMNHLMQVEKR